MTVITTSTSLPAARIIRMATVTVTATVRRMLNTRVTTTSITTSLLPHQHLSWLALSSNSGPYK